MIPDLHWLRNQLDSAAGSATTAELDSSATQDFRNDIRGLWNDACSREMDMRYLTPVADNQDKTAEHLRLHREDLHQGLAALQKAVEHGRATEKLSREIAGILTDVSSVSRLIASIDKEIESHLGEADHQIRKSKSTALEADQAGNSAVARRGYTG